MVIRSAAYLKTGIPGGSQDTSCLITLRNEQEILLTKMFAVLLIGDGNHVCCWEEVNNPDFNRAGFHTVRNEPGRLLVSTEK